jgi:hypothetical protein
MGIAYLVWSSLSQTTVGLSVVYSDAATGLENPIAIQNKSDIFSIRNISWQCRIIEANYEPDIQTGYNLVKMPENISVIKPNTAINMSCQRRDNFQVMTVEGKKLLSAYIIIDVEYDADFFGWFYYHRKVTVPFRWVGTISQPQWVQWDYVSAIRK